MFTPVSHFPEISVFLMFFPCHWHYRNEDQKSPNCHRSHRLRIWMIGRFFSSFCPPPDGRKREIWKMSSRTTSTALHLHLTSLSLDGKSMRKMHRRDVTCVAVILLLRQKKHIFKITLFKIT